MWEGIWVTGRTRTRRSTEMKTLRVLGPAMRAVKLMLVMSAWEVALVEMAQTLIAAIVGKTMTVVTTLTQTLTIFESMPGIIIEYM